MATRATTSSEVGGVTKQWKEFDLDKTRQTLDAEAIKVAEQQEAATGNRRRLAEATKKFKADPDEVKLKSVGALIKTYQEEVDRLTLRSAAAEKSFITVYKSLSELPDPAPYLQKSQEDSTLLTNLKNLEQENTQLKKDNEEFHTEFKFIKNQEVTIRNLEEKLKEYESSLEATLETKTIEIQNKCKEDLKKESLVMKERETELKRQQTRAMDELQRVRQAHEDTQAVLFRLKSKNDDDLAAKQSQIELLVNENERINENLTLIKRERDKLKENENNNINNNLSKNNELEYNLAQNEMELNKLREIIEGLEKQNQTLQTEKTNEVNFLKTNLETVTNQLKTTQNNINNNLNNTNNPSNNNNVPTIEEYNKLVHELKILKSITDYDTNTNSVEKFLKERARKLETENVHLKTSLASKDESLSQLSNSNTQLLSQLSSSSSLIQKLESQLELSSNNPNPNLDNPNPNPNNLHASNSEPEDNNNNSTNNNNNNSMLEVICEQRDRYRNRAGELEAEVRKLGGAVTESREKSERYRADNVKLYEKIRYLQSYGARGGGGDLENGIRERGGGEGEYRRMYEESVNPFAEFRGKEKMERYRQLNAAEKVTLNLGKFFLGSKVMRTFLFFYSIALHLLVFVILYGSALSQAPKH